MRSWTIALAGVLALVMATDTLMAQPPAGSGQRQPRQGRGGDKREAGPARGMRLPPSPLMRTLDTDKDGALSADEIKNAAASLKKLDKNDDGKLSGKELRPPRPPKRPGGGPPGGEEFIKRFMSFDKDGDGKVSDAELPERMQRMMQFADTNKDGLLDEEEIKKMVKRRAAGHRPGAGKGPGRGKGPGGGPKGPGHGGGPGGSPKGPGHGGGPGGGSGTW